MSRSPRAVVIAGPNGAGKSSAAPAVLRDFARVSTYVNADVIAQGLSAFRPDEAAVEAGRVMLRRLDSLLARGEDFAFETTLSGRTARGLLERARAAGCRTFLFYFWLPSVELSVERVRLRVASGGHDVPEATIRRRFGKSVRNFWHLYRGLVDEWRLYDASDLTLRPLVAEGRDGRITVILSDVWAQVERTAAPETEVEDPR